MGPIHPDYADALRQEKAMYEQAGRDDRAAEVVTELARIGDEQTLAEIAAALELQAAEQAEADAAAKAADQAKNAKPAKPAAS